jgi:hypothetical protein
MGPKLGSKKLREMEVFMKRIIFIAAITITASTAYAADTGTLLLQGTVALVNNIVVTPNGSNNTTLNILNGSTALVAKVSESSNNLTGYKINAKSLNGSELRNGLDATKKTTYTISYDGGSAVTLSTSYQQVKNVTSLTGLTNNASAVNATVAAYAAAPAGTYSDTITFQIVANP